MRYLTDPIEIRAFRKKYIKKITRNYVQKAQRAFLDVTACAACLTVWVVCLTLLVACTGFMLQNFTVNW